MSGREYGYLNGDSNVERTVKPAQNGRTLELTIDVNIQKIGPKYLESGRRAVEVIWRRRSSWIRTAVRSWRWIRRPVTI
ncbi:MAG: hypothetical protein ACLTR6_10590 [Clostridium fessum]